MPERDRAEQAQLLVDEMLGRRLEEMDEYPGLREAVIDGVANRYDSISERVRQQFDHLRSPRSKRVPDAYFADEEAAEDELQKAAAGIRTALAISGIISDPVAVEQHLAQDLMSSGIWSLRDEASRFPRPTTRAQIIHWSLIPVPWLDDKAAQWPPREAAALAGVHNITEATADLVGVEEEPYTGWVQVAFLERMRTLATNYPIVPSRHLMMATGLEIGAGVAGSSFPLSSCPPDLWVRQYKELVPHLNASRAESVLGSGRGPIAALADSDDWRVGPQHGPGLHPFLLSPRIEVVALLGLRPENPASRYVLVDDDGPGAVCRQWQSFLIHDGSYGDLVPAIHGSDLILRGDLFERLTAAIGRRRLSLGLMVDHSSEDDPNDELD